MKKILFIIAIAILSITSCTKSQNTKVSEENMEYFKKFDKVKKNYPFKAWEKYPADGLDQYTKENCYKAQKIMDDLIINLANISEGASEEEKVKFFKIAVEAFNDLNSETYIIETMEREEIFEIFEAIAGIAGIDTSKYGDGEGIASEWREW